MKEKDAKILEGKEKFESLLDKTMEMEAAFQEVGLQLPYALLTKIVVLFSNDGFVVYKRLLETIEGKHKELEKQIEEKDETIHSLEESNLSLKQNLSENCRRREKDLALLENRLANLIRFQNEILHYN